MATSVKMSLEAKNLLDAVQARLVLTRSKKLSQQEILEAMVRFSAEREDELTRYLAGVTLPLTKKEAAAIMAVPVDWGVQTSEKDIDTLLYGGK
jgi:uncharacterized protein YqeY